MGHGSLLGSAPGSLKGLRNHIGAQKAPMKLPFFQDPRPFSEPTRLTVAEFLGPDGDLLNVTSLGPLRPVLEVFSPFLETETHRKP